MNSIEIFSGAGGLAKGLELAGSRHMAFIEWDADACNTLRENYGDSIVFEGDIREFVFDDYKGADIDVIAGGPPCQPFSLGGKAKGFSDDRDMFPAAISAIRSLTPKAFIFENVKGLLRSSFLKYLEYIILQLSCPEVDLPSSDWMENARFLHKVASGAWYTGVRYNVSYRLLNAADYGVPQKRERVIIVGFREDLQADWGFPAPTHEEDSLMWEKYVTCEYWEKHGIKNHENEEMCNMEKRRLVEKYGMWPPQLKPWRTVRDAFAGLEEPNGSGEHRLREGARAYPGHTGSDIDKPAKTIKAGDHGVPGGENMVRFPDGRTRYFSVLEGKRIQTFPDDYIITGAWTEAMRQLGNAVPVRLAYVIGTSVLQTLAVTRSRQAKWARREEQGEIRLVSPNLLLA